MVEEEKKRQAEDARRKHEERKQKRRRKLTELARFGWERRQEMWSELRMQTDEATAATQFAERWPSTQTEVHCSKPPEEGESSATARNETPARWRRSPFARRRIDFS